MNGVPSTGAATERPNPLDVRTTTASKVEERRLFAEYSMLDRETYRT